MRKMTKLFAVLGSVVACSACAVLGLNAVEVSADAPAVQTHGVNIRLDETGIRFISSVSAEYAEGYEIGTLIVPKAVLGNKVLNHNEDTVDADEVSYENVIQTKWANEALADLPGFAYDDSRSYFNAVLTSIPNDHYGTVLVARAYAEKDGVYVYGETVEHSIADVAATLMQRGETEAKYVDYIDGALGEKVPSMQSSLYVGKGETTLQVENTNGYDVIWSTSDDSVATVEDGVLTAVANGNVTVTGKLGSSTFTSSVQVGDLPAGEVVALSSQFVCPNTSANIEMTDSIIAPVGNSLAKATAKTFYLDLKIALASNLYDYEQVQFFVYNPQVNGRTVRWNGQDIVNVNNGWTLVTLNTSVFAGCVGDNFVSFRIYRTDYSDITGEQFYVSDVYAVKASGAKKVVDFTADNYADKAVANNNGNSSLSFANGLLKSTFSSYSANCNLGIKFTATDYIGMCKTITFGVYSHQTTEDGNRKLYFGDTAIAKIVPGWNIITLDVSALDSLKDQKINIADKSGWSGMANYSYSFTDIFAVETDDVLVDFTAENTGSIVTIGGGNGNKCEYFDGMLKSTNGAGTCNLSFTFKNQTMDITEYKQIKFAVCNVTGNGRTFYYNGATVTNVYSGWTYITIDVTDLTTLNGFAFSIHQSQYQGMDNEVYYITDIYGVK